MKARSSKKIEKRSSGNFALALLLISALVFAALPSVLAEGVEDDTLTPVVSLDEAPQGNMLDVVVDSMEGVEDDTLTPVVSLDEVSQGNILDGVVDSTGGVEGNIPTPVVFSLDEVPQGKALVNVVDSIKLVNRSDANDIYFKWTKDTNTYVTGPNLKSAGEVWLYVDWTLPNSPKASKGDYFTVSIPNTIFNYGGTDYTDDVWVGGIKGDTRAGGFTVSKNSGNWELKVIFDTDYVTDHDNVSGTISYGLQFIRFSGGESDPDQSLPFEMKVNGSVIATGNLAMTNPGPPSGDLNKPPAYAKYGPRVEKALQIDGYYYFPWSIWLNFGYETHENFSLTDIIPENSNHRLLTPALATELGITDPELSLILVKEFYNSNAPADATGRYDDFIAKYNASGDNYWGNFLRQFELKDGNEGVTPGADGGAGMKVSGLSINANGKGFSANLGRVTRPTEVCYYTIATVKYDDNAIIDFNTIKQLENTVNIQSSSYSGSKKGIVYDMWQTGGGSAIGNTYKFKFTKTGENDSLLSGAEFVLSRDENFSAVYRTANSDASGIVEFNNLLSGTYYLKEHFAPGGYVLDSSTYTVVISDSGITVGGKPVEGYKVPPTGNPERIGDSTAAYKFPNTKTAAAPTGSLCVTKVDSLSSTPLAGAKFILYYEDGANNKYYATESGSTVWKDNQTDAAVLVSGADGKVTVSGLPYKTYYLKETGAPSGYQPPDNPVMEIEINSTGLLEKAFENEKIPPSAVSTVLRAVKSLVDSDGNHASIQAGEFTFVLKNENGDLVEEVVNGENGENGEIEFSPIVFDSVGDYKYRITEKTGSVPDIIYDSTEYEVVVTIATDVDTGNLHAEKTTITKVGGSITSEATFTNTIQPPSAASTILRAVKSLVDSNGNYTSMQAGEFTFVLKNGNGDLVEEVANEVNGEIEFSPIVFDSVGDYKYRITEKTGSDPDIIYDSTEYEVIVTIATDAGTSNLHAEKTTITKVGGSVTSEAAFTNTIKPPSAANTVLRAVKSLVDSNGSPASMQAGEFTFTLKNESGSLIEEVVNATTGEIVFSSIEFDSVGDYKYRIAEKPGSAPGVLYDSTEYEVIVTIALDTDTNELYVDKTAIAKVGGSSVNEIAFANITNSANAMPPSTTSTVLQAAKSLVNANGTSVALQSRKFTFALRSATDVLIEEAVNTPTGEIVFSPLNYTGAGDYEYTITEIPGSDSNITYDGTEYRVTVTVGVDTNTGGLVVENTAITRAGGESVNAIIFTNAIVERNNSDSGSDDNSGGNRRSGGDGGGGGNRRSGGGITPIPGPVTEMESVPLSETQTEFSEIEFSEIESSETIEPETAEIETAEMETIEPEMVEMEMVGQPSLATFSVVAPPVIEDVPAFDEIAEEDIIYLSNAWAGYSAVHYEDDIYIIYDEYGVPLGYVILDKEKSLDEIDLDDEMIPFGIPEIKNNPKTGASVLESFLTRYVFYAAALACIAAAGAMLVFRKRMQNLHR